jgi:hypothetical protein
MDVITGTAITVATIGISTTATIIVTEVGLPVSMAVPGTTATIEISVGTSELAQESGLEFGLRLSR